MIKITDRFYINANSKNYILQEKTTVQDTESENYGKEVFKELGYHSTLESCLKGFLKATTREFIGKEQENTLQELLRQIKATDEFLKSLGLDV